MKDLTKEGWIKLGTPTAEGKPLSYTELQRRESEVKAQLASQQKQEYGIPVSQKTSLGMSVVPNTQEQFLKQQRDFFMPSVSAKEEKQGIGFLQEAKQYAKEKVAYAKEEVGYPIVDIFSKIQKQTNVGWIKAKPQEEEKKYPLFSVYEPAPKLSLFEKTKGQVGYKVGLFGGLLFSQDTSGVFGTIGKKLGTRTITRSEQSKAQEQFVITTGAGGLGGALYGAGIMTLPQLAVFGGGQAAFLAGSSKVEKLRKKEVEKVYAKQEELDARSLSSYKRDADRIERHANLELKNNEFSSITKKYYNIERTAADEKGNYNVILTPKQEEFNKLYESKKKEYQPTKLEKGLLFTETIAGQLAVLGVELAVAGGLSYGLAKGIGFGVSKMPTKIKAIEFTPETNILKVERGAVKEFEGLKLKAPEKVYGTTIGEAKVQVSKGFGLAKPTELRIPVESDFIQTKIGKGKGVVKLKTNLEVSGENVPKGITGKGESVIDFIGKKGETKFGGLSKLKIEAPATAKIKQKDFRDLFEGVSYEKPRVSKTTTLNLKLKKLLPYEKEVLKFKFGNVFEELNPTKQKITSDIFTKSGKKTFGYGVAREIGKKQVSIFEQKIIGVDFLEEGFKPIIEIKPTEEFKLLPIFENAGIKTTRKIKKIKNIFDILAKKTETPKEPFSFRIEKPKKVFRESDLTSFKMGQPSTILEQPKLITKTITKEILPSAVISKNVLDTQIRNMAFQVPYEPQFYQRTPTAAELIFLGLPTTARLPRANELIIGGISEHIKELKGFNLPVPSTELKTEFKFISAEKGKEFLRVPHHDIFSEQGTGLSLMTSTKQGQLSFQSQAGLQKQEQLQKQQQQQQEQQKLRHGGKNEFFSITVPIETFKAPLIPILPWFPRGKLLEFGKKGKPVEVTPKYKPSLLALETGLKSKKTKEALGKLELTGLQIRKLPKGFKFEELPSLSMELPTSKMFGSNIKLGKKKKLKKRRLF
jgi:hypothetical protein